MNLPNDNKPRILIVEDERTTRLAFELALADRYQVTTAESAEQGLELLATVRPDLVLTDMFLPGESGLSFIPKVKAAIPECIVLVMTAHPSVELAVEVMRVGARDFLVKPVESEALDVAFRRELEHQKIAIGLKRQREQLVQNVRDDDVVCDSQPMQAVMQAAAEVATSGSTVLLCGESGTGKETIAQFIHRSSARAAQPLTVVGCGGTRDSLETELFGADAQGDVAPHVGRIERASGGTIVLDEIAELPASIQTRFLQLLRDGEIERVGGSRVSVDVRVIALTSRDLNELRSSGTLSEDLYWRLSVFPIEIPTLRSRPADISGLWARAVERVAKREGCSVPSTAPDTLNALFAYDWPGNVRELENVAERAVVIAREQAITTAHLPTFVRSTPPVHNEAGIRIPGSTLEEIEKVAILKTLEASNNSTTKAARMLGISVRKIQYRLREWKENAGGSKVVTEDDDLGEPTPA